MLVGAGPAGFGAEAQPTPEQARFFEREVRPILAANCLSCHGEKKERGGLRLTSRESLLAGGDSGPAVVPGKPEESLLIEAIHQGSLKMPPKGKLSEREVAALEQWVKLGAPWPGGSNGSAGNASRRARGAGFSDEDRNWWAFQPVREPAVPVTAEDRWSRNPVDRFVGSRLHEAGLTPAPEADRITLIRRLSFDLIGLPPSRAEIDAFLADTSSDAYERLVDRLLASPRYGERWARHWLDLVRYADSDGYRIDHYRPSAWLYRDYVIRSFNDDKPYDRFVCEQIAGDELFPGDVDARVATGYLRHWVYEYNNRDVRGQWTVILNDITDTTGDVFLGLGIQCARCHDHKFDPILQKDYYRLQAFFAPLLPRDDLLAASTEDISRHASALAAWESKTADLRRELADREQGYREQAAHDAIKMFPEDIQAMIRKPRAEQTPLEHQLAELAYRQVDYAHTQLDARLKGTDKDRILALRKQLAAFDREKPKPLPAPLTVTDVGPEAPPIVLPKKSDEPVAPGFLTILDPGPAAIAALPDAPHSTGRRAALARWLTRPDNPLATRVIVNRVWQYHFGRGLAANPSDFGRLGEPPSHAALLDWLTARFVREGWSLKQLHRLILTSATYRQSTRHPGAELCRLKDPENRFYWRGATRRLDAEQIRDAVLAVTGELDPSAGGPGADGAQPRRTIYTRVLRNARDPLLDVFDLPIFFSSAASRDTTTTPLQSLFLINNQSMLLHARAFATRLEREAPDDEHRVEAAYRLAFGRAPSDDERAAALRFLGTQGRRIDPREAGSADAEFLKGKLPHRDGQAAILEPAGPQRRFDVASGAPLETGDFTIEAFFLVRSVYDTGAVRTVAAQWNGDIKAPGWSFGITGKGSRRKPQTLVLQLVGKKQGGDFGEVAVFSDQQIQLDRPYYAAASVRLAHDGAGEVTFSLKDLSNDDEPLLVASVPHTVTGGLNNALPVTLGGRSGPAEGAFDGVIDDVRLSAGPLAAGELLFNTEARNPRTVGYWRFETEPGVFRDSSGHGLDLRPAVRPSKGVDPAQAALADFCHVLFNASEFLYVE
ncbi:MAG: DUF1549 domain-containing protein [Isosphaeraceae bacterium]|nr:DUF1549 domain-containing protein [Isosphaeraceae bacterium]